VIGAVKPESDDEEDNAKAEAGNSVVAAAPVAAPGNKAPSKAALAFKPRAVKRPAPKSVPRLPTAKTAKPTATDVGSSKGSNASAAGYVNRGESDCAD
jgi:hypothetical protein